MFFKTFLQANDFEKLATLHDHPQERVMTIVNVLLKKMFLYDGHFYILRDEFKVYEKKITHIRADSLLETYCSKLVEESFHELPEILRRHYKYDFPKLFKGKNSMFDNTFYRPINNRISLEIERHKSEMTNPYKYQIHFQNGYFDLRTMKLEERSDAHIVTNYIRRNYEQPSMEAVNLIMGELSKIISNKEDRDYLLFSFGKALSGDVNTDQTNLFLLGAGSTGKSTLMNMIKEALSDAYLVELKSDTFVEGNSKIDKIMNEFLNNSLLRIAWVNEMTDKKVDSSLFKSFCEGSLQTTTLYKDGINNFSHYCKLIFTSNTKPKVTLDSGSIRRIDAFTMKSRFTKDESEVDEANHVYQCKDNFLLTFTDELRNALFYILAKYCNEWIEDPKKYLTPENFKDTKADIVESNDLSQIQDFFETCIEITNMDKDRMSKKVFLDTFRAKYPGTRVDERRLLLALENRKVEWNRQVRNPEGSKGAYVGIRLKPNEMVLNCFQSAQMIAQLQAENQMLQKYNLQLTQKIKELENKHK